jgi:C4-dicarboxylate-specific signal transduction histidine kinase
VNHPTVLIVAQDPAVARDIVSRWQSHRSVPSFTLLSTDFPRVDGLGHFDLAIIQAENGHARDWRQTVETMAEAVLHIGSVQEKSNASSKAVFVQRSGDWLNTTILLGAEILRRCELTKRMQRIETNLTSSEKHASLGRYMLDTRHSFNNALTSVLGNAELLMLDADTFGTDKKEQIETIHAMALKLYEMMQRFSSLEAELRFEEKNVRELPRTKAAAYGS